MTKPDASPYQIILAVDSTQKEQLVLALVRTNQPVVSKKYENRAQDLLVVIEEFLAKQNIDLTALNAVAVYLVADSLTGTRMGIAAVNALAWLQHIPVIELTGPSFSESLNLLNSSPKQFQTALAAKPQS